MSHLKHGPSGNLIHGPSGNLVRACGTACPCVDATACDLCPGDTPTQFHVTFSGIVPCTGCVSCPATGESLAVGSGAINGTYLLSRNGACAWTTYSPTFAESATLYASTNCTGTGTPINFAVQHVRISATQFRLQITDDTNTMLLFDATITSDLCCASYTVSNDLTTCGCAGSSPTIYTLATGGTATVTRC